MIAAKIDKARLTRVSLFGHRAKNGPIDGPVLPGQGVNRILLESGASLLLETGRLLLSESNVKQIKFT